MKVTIITAVRNGEHMIGATLESVSRQSYGNIEHIVIDGASTDATLSVVKNRGQHVAVVISEPDVGVYEAFNKGLARSTGDVVAFLNAGDVYCSDEVVGKAVNALACTGRRAVFGDVQITEGIGGRVLRRYRSSHFSPGRIAWGFMPAHPAQFLARNLYDEFGCYDSSYRIAGDFEWVARVFGRGLEAFSCLAEPLVRMPTGGLSSRGIRSRIEITREMHRACDQNGIPCSWLRLLTRVPIKYATEVLGLRTGRLLNLSDS